MEKISSLICYKLPCLDQALNLASTVPLYIGIAFSVAGIALTIFLGAHFLFGIGFALLGIVCAIGLYHTRKAAHLKSLQKKIDSLETLKNALQKTNKSLKENVSQLTKNVSTFSNENEKLKSNISAMASENNTLQANTKELEEEIKKIKAENAQLGIQISTLKSTVENSKKILEKLQIERQKLEKAGRTLDAGIQKLLTKADKSLEQIKENLNSSEKFLATLAVHLEGDLKESVKELNKNLKIIVSKNLIPIFESVAQQNAELASISKEIEEKTHALEIVKKELGELQGKLKARERAIAHETDRLSKVVTKAEDLVERKLHDPTPIPSSSLLNRPITEIAVES